MDIFSIRCTAVVTTIYTELSHPHLYSFFYSQIGLDASLRLYSLLILMGYLQVRNRTRLNLRHISIGRKVYSTTWARLYCTVYTLQYCCVQHRECPSSSVLAIGSTLLFHPAASHLVTRLYLMIIVQYLIPYTFINQSNVNSQGIYSIGNTIR